MFRNAIEKINKFYDLDLSKNTHADEIFDILNEIIQYETSAILYLTPNLLTLEFGKNFAIYEAIKIDDDLSAKLYDVSKENIVEDLKKYLKTSENILAQRLIVKGAVLGIIFVTRTKPFSNDEANIFKTCSIIIANLIKDLELSKVLKMQVEVLEAGLSETHKAYETIKKQNAKIKANEKLQNQFISNVSHDLRTPLNCIISFSETLDSEIFGKLNPKQSDYLKEIRSAGIKLLGMVNEILDISKIESKTIKLNPSEIDIEVLINEVCNTLQPLYEKKEITITKNYNKVPQIKGDYIKLQQVIFNILGNAIKFSPKNSEIHIKTETFKKKILISIKDFGIGIEPKYHKKIFNKFFQIESTLSKTETSTGLGLAIAKEFVKLHNGKIELISQLNEGTEFIIKLPNS